MTNEDKQAVDAALLLEDKIRERVREYLFELIYHDAAIRYEIEKMMAHRLEVFKSSLTQKIKDSQIW